MRYFDCLRCVALSCLLGTAGVARLSAAADIPIPRMVAIPGGTFSMGSEDGASWEKPVHRVEVAAFAMSARPVSNAEFRAFRPSYRNPADDAAEAAARAVSWEDATKYAAWLSEKTGADYRLPTEAEWERAARGGLEQKRYPWGDEPPVPDGKLGERSAWPAPRPNAWGLVIEYETWEWVADFYGREYYAQSPARDPKGPATGEFRVLRGGSYPNDPNSMSTYGRGSARPQTNSANIAFRVVSEGSGTLVSEARAAAAGASASEGRQAAAALAAPSDARAGASEAVRPGPVSAVKADPSDEATFDGVEASVESGEVVLTLLVTGQPEVRTMELKAPDRIVLDLGNATVATQRTFGERNVGELAVKKVRWAPFASDTPTVRVVVDLERAMAYSVDSLPGRITVRLQP